MGQHPCCCICASSFVMHVSMACLVFAPSILLPKLWSEDFCSMSSQQVELVNLQSSTSGAKALGTQRTKPVQSAVKEQVHDAAPPEQNSRTEP